MTSQTRTDEKVGDLRGRAGYSPAGVLKILQPRGFFEGGTEEFVKFEALTVTAAQASHGTKLEAYRNVLKALSKGATIHDDEMWTDAYVSGFTGGHRGRFRIADQGRGKVFLDRVGEGEPRSLELPHSVFRQTFVPIPPPVQEAPSNGNHPVGSVGSSGHSALPPKVHAGSERPAGQETSRPNDVSVPAGPAPPPKQPPIERSRRRGAAFRAPSAERLRVLFADGATNESIKAVAACIGSERAAEIYGLTISQMQAVLEALGVEREFPGKRYEGVLSPDIYPYPNKKGEGQSTGPAAASGSEGADEPSHASPSHSDSSAAAMPLPTRPVVSRENPTPQTPRVEGEASGARFEGTPNDRVYFKRMLEERLRQALKELAGLEGEQKELAQRGEALGTSIAATTKRITALREVLEFESDE
ncbi:MAG: hypothetical protein WD850_03530 [Candidatus Spechtbacterales bacterium]